MTTHDFARHRAWRWILLVTLLMALGALWACASNGGDDDDDAAEETDDDDDDTEEEFDPNHFTLGAPGTGDEEPTGRLIGWNIGRGTYYAASDDPFHGDGSEFGDWNTPSREAAMQSFSLLRPGTGETPYMRFSGLQIDGNLGADGYHFWNFVDPDRVAADTDNMAVFNYMDFIDKSDCLPTVTLNFGSGTAAEAGDYAQYL
ncbi:hypothetical protein KDL45_17140, partial [bacterium]|nr:hypothetical protein [bacterium]